jgi:transketolase
MRKQFRDTTVDLLSKDDRLAVLLGDIGVWGFNDALKQYPDRVMNIGILEQASIGVAAGMAMTGMIPIFHSIAPFVVERGYEFLKLDFGYQRLGGNFVSVGASYDYTALGPTHHCPADVALLHQIPAMEIVVPGTAKEFDTLFRNRYTNGNPTYFRLSEQVNKQVSLHHHMDSDDLIRLASRYELTIVAVGPVLDIVLDAVKHYELQCTVLYCTTVKPFDRRGLFNNCPSKKVLIVEPFSRGTLLYEVMRTFAGESVAVDCVGVPHVFTENYGSLEEQNEAYGLSIKFITSKIERMLNA